MRVFVLALAILLLPLRGWLGDAMALDVAPPGVAAQAAHAMHAETDDHATHHTADLAHDHGSTAAQPQPDCQSTCGNCQLCHTVALTVWPALALLGEAPRQAPVFEPVAFASAEPARGFKPPIS